MAVYFCIGISRNYRCFLFISALGEYIIEINETKRNYLKRKEYGKI